MYNYQTIECSGLQLRYGYRTPYSRAHSELVCAIIAPGGQDPPLSVPITLEAAQRLTRESLPDHHPDIKFVVDRNSLYTRTVFGPLHKRHDDDNVCDSQYEAQGYIARMLELQHRDTLEQAEALQQRAQRARNRMLELAVEGQLTIEDCERELAA